MEEKNKLVITQWALEDRPREKLLLKGIQSLSNAELIAILIGSGNKRETAVDLAQRILNSTDNNLNILGKRSVSELIVNFDGIGEAKAISIIAALELGRRRKSEEIRAIRQIKCSQDLYNYFYANMVDLAHEEFWVVFLNRSKRIIDTKKISQGGIHTMTVDIRIILKSAIEQLAASIALCHNHPSGNPVPSPQDDELTQKIKCGALMLDISVIDHVIISENGYYSYADQKRL